MNERSQQEQLTDLLADRAVQALSEAEQQQLESLLAAIPATQELDFERAAAAAHLTQAMENEMLPNHLRAKLLADARSFFGDETPVSAPTVVGANTANVVPFPMAQARPSRWQAAGWYAAAACFALALIVSWPQIKSVFVSTNVSDPAVVRLREEELIEANRNQLLNDTSAVKESWAATKYPGVQNVEGDVIWSSEKQQGVMRFKNLTVNDPTKNVYQLWIFDVNQDEKYPVDGGVFNVTKSGEILVPIQAKLKITKPTLFAVTIEKPGGVVVSKRDKLILTAKIG